MGDAAGYVEPFTGEGMACALQGRRAVVPFALRAIEGHPSARGMDVSTASSDIQRRLALASMAAWILRHVARDPDDITALLVAGARRSPHRVGEQPRGFVSRFPPAAGSGLS